MANIKGDKFNNDLDGRNGNDVILGLAGNDELDGNAGNDTLDGGKGNDELDGDAANDVLKGGKGNDQLDGGAGTDQLFGGKGDDLFTFDNNDGKDTIGDFGGGDRIEFDVDNLTFTDLNFASKGGDTVITWDGGGANSITLTGVDAASLSRSDFVFDD